MDPNELLQVLVAARKARADGVPIDQINASIQRRTGASDMAELARMWAEAANEAEDPGGALREYAADGRGKWAGAVSDFGRSFAEGATFGFADELAGAGAALIPGGKGYTEARDESRERMDRLREVAPGATLAGEIAGGVAVPVMGTGGLFRSAAPVARAAGRGAVAGAVGGGLYGAGSSEGGATERALGGVEGALTGGLFGGLAGAATYPIARGIGGVYSRLTGRKAGERGARLAGKMVEGAEVDPSVRAMQEATEAGKARVSATHFQPIERRLAEGLDDPNVIRVLQQDDIAPHAKKVMGEVPRLADAPGQVRSAEEMAQRAMDRWEKTGSESALEQYHFWSGPEGRARISAVRAQPPTVPKASRAPTFTELQSIRQRVQNDITSAKRGGDLNRMKDAQKALASLDEALEQAIPDYADARAEWARVVQPERAFNEAQKLFNKTSEEILIALESQPSREAADAFRAGLLNRFTTKLQQRSTPSNSAITALTEAGPEMEAKLRAIFPDEESFQTFMRAVRVEHRWQVAREMLRRTLPWLAGGGVGVGIGQSLFQ